MTTAESIGQKAAAALRADGALAGIDIEWAAAIISAVADSALSKDPVDAPASSPSLLWGDAKTIPPEPAWVDEFSKSIGWPLDGAAWCHHYAAKGWVVGRTRMKNWQSAVHNWKSSGWRTGPAHAVQKRRILR